MQQQSSEYHRGLPGRESSMASSTVTGDYGLHGDGLAARRVRKVVHRRTVDYTSTVVRYMQVRMSQHDAGDSTVLQPTPVAAVDMLPAVAYPDNPATSFATKFVHASTNKNRCSINRVVWTPPGRRLITGSQSGEFTLWNGQSFNFEMILQAHDQAVRSMVWSHNENWMVTGDDGGFIKYWQTNMNNVKANKSAHREAVRDLSFCSTDLKFCSCSDDTTVKVWDFARCQEERSLEGHGWDVKSVDWHPTKSLLVSGGKDNLIKLWDAKTGRVLCSLHGHKNTVLSVKWNQNGNWVLTASKDQIIKLYDIRTLKELESYHGHRKDVTALAWHPFHEELFVSGSFDGSIIHWLVGHEAPQVEIHNAHESAVWDLAWHPMGHILCSGSNDHTTKFWCRNRPGDTGRDKQAGYIQGSSEQNPVVSGHPFQTGEGPTTPGPFAAGGTMRSEGTIPGVGAAMPFSLPTMDTTPQSESPQQAMLGSTTQGVHPGGPHPPFAPHPSIATSSQQMYQQTQQIPTQQLQQHQMVSQLQQSPTLPPQPPNVQQQLQQQLQGPSMHLALHAHLPPPPRQPLSQPPQLGMPSTMPSSMALSMPSTLSAAPMLHSGQYSSMVPLSGQLAQGSSNQMRPQISQLHALGLSSMHPGHVSGSSLPTGIGGFGNGITNVIDSQNSVSGIPPFPSNTVGVQLQAPAAIAPTSGVYSMPQGGPLQTSSITPGLHTYQTTAPPNTMDMRGLGINQGTNVGLGMGMGMGMGVPPHPRGPAPPQP